MNNLESYYFRKDQINEILAGIHYPTEFAKESTIGAWANSNLSIEEIQFLLYNKEKEMEDIKNKKDLRIAMEKEQLRKGVITR